MILDLIGKGLGLATKLLGADSKVAEAITTVKTAIAGSPETQARLKELELEEMRLAMESEADIRKLYGLEIQSKRGFVANARPAVLWIASSLIAVNFGLIPLVNPAKFDLRDILRVTSLMPGVSLRRPHPLRKVLLARRVDIHHSMGVRVLLHPAVQAVLQVVQPLEIYRW